MAEQPTGLEGLGASPRLKESLSAKLTCHPGDSQEFDGSTWDATSQLGFFTLPKDDGLAPLMDSVASESSTRAGSSWSHAGSFQDHQELLIWLPMWARHEESAKHAIACIQSGNTHPVARAAGPAILPEACSTVVLWVFYAVFPWLELQFTSCPSDQGAATISMWTLIFYVPVLSVSLILEYIAMCRALPAMLVVTGPFHMFSLKLSFGAYFVFAGTLSVLGHMDFATIGLMVAKAVKTDECSELGKSRVAKIWHDIQASSMFGGLPLVAGLRISTFTIIGYSLIFLQLIFALGSSVKLRVRRGESFHYDLQAPHEYPLWYDTAFYRKQGHGVALFALADANRMNTIKMKEWRYISVAKKKWNSRLIHDELWRAVTHFYIYQLMSSAVQPNIQVSILALSIAASDTNQFQWTTVVSIMLSLFTAFKRLVDEGLKVWVLYSMVQGAAISGLERRETDRARDVAAKSWKATFAVSRFILYWLVSFLMLAYATTHLIATVFVCSEGVWNPSGCVDID